MATGQCTIEKENIKKYKDFIITNYVNNLNTYDPQFKKHVIAAIEHLIEHKNSVPINKYLEILSKDKNVGAQYNCIKSAVYAFAQILTGIERQLGNTSFIEPKIYAIQYLLIHYKI